MTLDTSQLDKLRSHPHKSEMSLVIYRPKTVMSALVNSATITRNAYTVPFDTVSFGDYLNVKRGMTLLVGTQAGLDDVGRIRVRSITASTMVVAENSNIAWSDNLHLTVIAFFDLTAIYPRIIQDIDDPTELVFYKDYDIPYTNQNSVLGTLICAGSHRAAIIENGSASLEYTAVGTTNVKGSALSYSWSFEGGTPSTFTGITPGTITYSTPGDFLTSLTVSGSGGEVDTTYRYVSIRQRDGVDSSIQKWTFDELAGSRQEGGYSAKVTVYENLPDIRAGDVAFILHNPSFGNQTGSIDGTDNVFFVGYVLDDTISYNYADSQVSFSLGTTHAILKTVEGFPISVESVPSPSTWYELQDMDVRKALYHYLRWHTTLLNTVDFQYISDNRKFQYFDTDRTSLWESLSAFFSSSLLAKMVCDRRGKIWAEIDFTADDVVVTSPIRQTIEKVDWVGEPSIEEKPIGRLSYIELGGIAFSGVFSGGDSVPLISNAPGNAPAYWGNSDTRQGMIVETQAQLNETCGRVFENRNYELPTINLNMSGNYSHIDLAPQDLYGMDIRESDTVRGKPITGTYQPDRVEFSYVPESLSLGTSVTFSSVLIDTPDGQTVPIPQTPDVNWNPQPLPGFDFPLFPFPALPGSGTPPQFIPVEPDINITNCVHDLSAPSNGAFSTYIRGTFTTMDKHSPYGRIRAAIRNGTASNPTTYAISGKFEKLDVVTGNYIESTDDGFYTVYGLQGGTRVAVGVKDPVVTTQWRTGKFFPPHATNIDGIEIALNKDPWHLDFATFTGRRVSTDETVTVNFSVWEFYDKISEMTFNLEASSTAKAPYIDYFAGVTGRVERNTLVLFDTWFDYVIGITSNAKAGTMTWNIRDTYTIPKVTGTEFNKSGSFYRSGYFQYLEMRVNAKFDLGTTGLINTYFKIQPRALYRIKINDVFLYNICQWTE